VPLKPSQNPITEVPMLLRPLAPKQSNIKSADNKRFLILVAKKRGKLAQKRGASHKLAGCGAANKRCCLMQHLLLLQLLLLHAAADVAAAATDAGGG